MTIKLTKEQHEKAIDEIKYYYLNEREEEISNLAADMLLDFFIKEIAPMIYNQALDDAKTWFTTKLVDLDIDFQLLEKE